MKNNRKNRKLLAIRLKNITGTKVSKRTMFKLVNWHNNSIKMLKSTNCSYPLTFSEVHYFEPDYRYAALTYDMEDVCGGKNAFIYPTQLS